ncbi:unnamed protein product [Durusdinium trenchii]|uniref:CDAN1-interacting nuclease 1 n=1 Tax=Durusdinium trenchii TaxID=1381693 RepID=A0ABP0HAI0_9DINO
MASPSEMERSERKRQYSALRRAIHRAANPALTAKFSLCNDTERFAMLKQWVVNPDTSSIEIEERYVSWVEELRTDRYVSVSIFQLEKIYGKSTEAKKFIAELCKGHLDFIGMFSLEGINFSPCQSTLVQSRQSLCKSGQEGTPHPQAPESKKGRIYKVLKEVIHEQKQGSTGSSSMSLSGRVRGQAAKEMLSKQLGKALDGFGQGTLDLKTGRINQKKVKKPKTPEQLALQECKVLHGKTLISDIQKYGVRNSDELLSALRLHALIELTESGSPVFPGANQDDRLRTAYVEFCRECRRHKISSILRYFEQHLGVTSLGKSGKKYPSLAQKHLNGAAGLDHLVFDQAARHNPLLLSTYGEEDFVPCWTWTLELVNLTSVTRFAMS